MARSVMSSGTHAVCDNIVYLIRIGLAHLIFLTSKSSEVWSCNGYLYSVFPVVILIVSTAYHMSAVSHDG